MDRQKIFKCVNATFLARDAKNVHSCTAFCRSAGQQQCRCGCNNNNNNNNNNLKLFIRGRAPSTERINKLSNLQITLALPRKIKL